MFSESDEKLTDIERRMIEMVEEAWQQYQDSADSRPVPLPLIDRMEKVHRAILARLAKRGGMNMAEMLRNPQAALLQLDRTRELLRRQIQAQEERQAS